MALRIRVELVPHGYEPRAQILDEITVANNGTGVRGGRDEGGVGNYDIYDAPLAKVKEKANWDRAELRAGEINGVPRTKGHRLELARRALQLVEQQRKNAGRSQ